MIRALVVVEFSEGDTLRTAALQLAVPDNPDTIHTIDAQSYSANTIPEAGKRQRGPKYIL